jgi:hypothetical protein
MTGRFERGQTVEVKLGEFEMCITRELGCRRCGQSDLFSEASTMVIIQ